MCLDSGIELYLGGRFYHMGPVTISHRGLLIQIEDNMIELN